MFITSEIPVSEHEPTCEESLTRICRFLLEYSVALFAAGATCIRLEMNVKRMAEALGVKVETTFMPRHIYMTVCRSADGESVTRIASVTGGCISFDVNTRLSSLSWELADGKIDFNTCVSQFKKIITPRPRCQWKLVFLVSLANASFCRLFGGDSTAMLIVAIATAVGFSLKLFLAERKIDLRVIMIVCAFVSSVLGATDSLFSLGTTPAVAIGTSVLYLVPGIPFLNSFSDMLNRHYICAFSRLTDTLVLTFCLSVGLGAGMWLMQVGMF